jgi:ATP-dependent DNA helicase PIF1
VVELAASGRNIFYTGSAGCGKSTVLHAIKARLRNMGKNVEVLAPTGKAALAINGITTWSYAGWTPNHHKRKLEELKKAARGRATRKRFKLTDTLIIDEISMVENLHLERLNTVMKSARRNDSAFGGVQVIVTGDFCQLPPVKPFQHCITCGSDLISTDEEEDTVYRCPSCNKEHNDSDKWAFRSEAWAECSFVHVHLKSIHRQNDPEFISILQKCRLGIPFTQDEVDTLMTHRSVAADAIKLFPTRDEVRRTNDEAFALLKSPSYPYICLDKFLWNVYHHPHLESKRRINPDNSLHALNDHRFERRIDLKIGMLVVLLVNLNLSEGLCNGSQGAIVGFEPYNEATLPRYRGWEHSTIKETYVKRFAHQQLQDRPQLGWPIVRFLNGTTRTIMPECEVHELGDPAPHSLLCRTQIPLAPAWAMTVHKSQGMTLDRVVVNLSRAFEEGQVYVALSRVRSLQGLKVEGNAQGLAVGKGGNPQVREFLKDKFGM